MDNSKVNLPDNHSDAPDDHASAMFWAAYAEGLFYAAIGDIALLLLLAVALFMLTGCAPAKFDEGQMVRSKVGDHVGMVIYRDCWSDCRYSVRFDGRRTDTSLLGSDGAQPLLVVRGIREYELGAVE